MNYIKTLLSLSFILQLTGCAKILNKDYQTVRFSSNKTIREIIIERDSFYVDTQSYKIDIFREKGVKQATIAFDSVAFDFDIRSRLSNEYTWGNLFSFYQLGYLVDLTSDRRFGYPSEFYFNVNNRKVQLLRWKPVQRGNTRGFVSLPFVNNLRVKAGGKDSLYTGIVGLSLGVEHFYRDDRYWSAHLGVATDNPHVRDGISFLEGEESASVLYAAIRHGQTFFNDFEIGYGLQVSRFKWRRFGAVPAQDETNTGVGVSLNAHYRFRQYLRLGLLYQPSFLKFNQYGKEVAYQHLISGELVWKF